MSARVFVEGGGDRRSQTACRKAFSTFFGRLLGDFPKPRIVASGSRNQAYADFSRSLTDDLGSFPVLLVDSEGPVAVGKRAAEHLRERDHWTGPLPEGQVHLMVQCMEAWFLADKTTLAQYYGHEFREAALPANPRIEDVPKNDLLDGLARATLATSKGRYHKTRHAFDILERLDPQSVGQQSYSAAALFAVLLRVSRLRNTVE